MFKKLFIGLILTAISLQGNADGLSSSGEIEELYFGTAGDYVRVTMNVSDSQSYCGEAGKPYVLYLDQSTEVSKEFYSTRVSVLLAAFAAKKKVQFWLVTNRCSPNKEPLINGVSIKH